MAGETTGHARHLTLFEESGSPETKKAAQTAVVRWVLDSAAKTQPSQLPPIADAFKPFLKRLQLSSDDHYLFVGSNGIPDHEMMVGITSWQQQVPLPQTYVGSNAWSIPIHPVPAEKPIPIKGRFLRGAIALSIDGVPIFNPQNNRGEISKDIGELDAFGGHCGRGDDYHYHVAPLFLEKIVGPGKPIAVALDGYPILGPTGTDGKPINEKTLDVAHGKTDAAGNYAYYASAKYPFVLGAFHGQVTEKDGQVEPQPSAHPIRPPGRPLRGAAITACSSPSPNHFTLQYEVDGDKSSIDYSVESDGTYRFVFTDAQGKRQEEVYRQGGKSDRRQSEPPRP